MGVQKLSRFVVLLVLSLGLLSCRTTPTETEITTTIESQVATAVSATVTALQPPTPSPAHTETAVPPTPSPASSPTLPPPTTAASPTSPPQRYLSRIKTTHTITVDLVTTLDLLAQTPQFDDPAWATEVEYLVAQLHANTATLGDMQVPPARREFQERVTTATTACDQVASTIEQAAKTADSALLQTAHTQLTACLPEILDIQQFLENTGGGNNSPSTNSATSWFTPMGCAGTSTGLIPLTDLGSSTYEGMSGGLYPGGSNTRPPAHEAAGLAIAATIQPLDNTGAVDAENGRIILLSIGMSNTTGEFRGFVDLVETRTEDNPQLLVINGAQPGGVARRMVSDDYDYWARVMNSVAEAGAAPEQVQVIWLKEADPAQNETFLEHTQRLQNELQTLVQMLKTRFPNLKMIYLSSRTYGGYANTRLNPEPYAYQTGFAVKWLIEDQLNGDPALNYDPANGTVAAPWLSWGPYLWADGLTPRSDGLTWACSDFLNDGTHPSPAARDKVAQMLWQFFTTDTTTQSWFLAEN